MSKYQLNDFTMFVAPTKNGYAITIPNKNYLNLNTALHKEVFGKVRLGLHKSEVTLILVPSDECGVQIPNSGSIRIPEFIAQITDRGIRLPARFTVSKDDEYWIGKLQSQAPLHPKLKSDKKIKRSFPEKPEEAD